MDAKIIILENSIELTGAFKSILEYSKSLSSECDFTFGIQRNSKIENNLRINHFNVFHISFLEIRKNINILIYLPVLIYNTFKILRYVKKNHIKVMHVNDIYNMLGVMSKIFIPKLYLIYHIRLLKSSYVSKLYAFWGYLINRYADRIICVSKTASESYPFNPKKMSVLYDSLSIDPDIKSYHDLKKIDTIDLYYIGNYIEGKGQDWAIEAFSRALETNPKLRLTFVGGTLGKKKNWQYKKDLIKRTESLNIQHLVTFMDQTDEISDQYSKADIVINFSENESFSMVCLESLAYGIPLIATESGGPSEIIDQGIDGLLVPNRDVEKMVEAILTLSQSKKLRKKFSINGPIKVKDKFDLQKNSIELLKIYRDGI